MFEAAVLNDRIICSVSIDPVLKSLEERLLSPGAPVETFGARPAAVLVPFVQTGGGWALVFTRRAEDLSTHRGEISFPGGRVDDGETTLDAALREAHEELGIVAAHVRVLGRLPRVHTVVSNFEIDPWVGLVPGTEFAPNPMEISEVLEVPLDTLRREGTKRVQKFIRDGFIYTNPAFDVGPNTIWGATARILEGLLDLMAPSRDGPP